MDFSNIQTLSDLLTLRNDDFSIEKLGIFEKNDDYDYIWTSGFIYTKYMNVIMSRVVEIEYSKDADGVDEELKYKYNPEALSMELYGTPLLSHLILMINRVGAHRFNKKSVKLLSVSDMSSIMSTIIAKEARFINDNRNKVFN